MRFKLSEFDNGVIYKPRKLNANADTLSKNPIEPISDKIFNVINRHKKREN